MFLPAFFASASRSALRPTSPRRFRASLLATCALTAVACSKRPAAPQAGESVDGVTPVNSARLAPEQKPPLGRAQVSIAPIGDSKVSGTLVLSELPDNAGVKIEGSIANLTAGNHGMHVHEVPDCKSADGMSAGPHFNPSKAPHGSPQDAKSHIGDLGNISADSYGRAMISIIKPAATLRDLETSLLNHAIIVHAKADDMHSQPAGDAGARIGCGVIEKI